MTRPRSVPTTTVRVVTYLPPSHGTYSAYLHRGCRCQECVRGYYLHRKRTRLGIQPPQHVDATGTRRRIRALARLGWTYTDIGDRLGIKKAAVAQLLTRGEKVRATTAERVAKVYDDLHMTPGPSSGARLRATRQGWPPPLAWDDETIDDPTETPNVGKADGRAGIHPDDIAWVCRHERWTWDQLAARFGVRPASLKTVLRRAGMHDLQARITDWSTEAAA